MDITGILLIESLGKKRKRKKEKREDRLAKVTKNLLLSVAVLQNKV